MRTLTGPPMRFPRQKQAFHPASRTALQPQLLVRPRPTSDPVGNTTRRDQQFFPRDAQVREMLLNTLFKYWTYRLFAPGIILRKTYDAFRELLAHDSRSHERMADLEDLYYRGKKEDFCRITKRYNALSASVDGMVTSLEQMAPGSFVTLREYFRKFDFYGRLVLAPPTLDFGPPFALPLTDPVLRPDLGGGKSCNLAVLAGILELPVPPGFVVTANSFHYLLEYNDLRSTINELLAGIDLSAPETLARSSSQLISLIKSAEIPPAIHDAILAAHTACLAPKDEEIRVAVRSSAVNEDGECSFAGQYATLLHVRKDNLLCSYLSVLASKYTPEALSYRIHCGLTDEETPMAVLVVQMIDSWASGVVYTDDPTGQDHTHLFIHSVRGQGEALVSGRSIPEVLTLPRQTSLTTGAEPLPRPTPLPDSSILTPAQTTTLADNARRIEDHFGTPQDIEWAISDSGQLLFLQARPLHPGTQAQTAETASPPLAVSTITETPLLTGGVVAALGQACGPAYCVNGGHPVEGAPAGAILVVRETLPAYVQVLDRIHGVLAEIGSVAGHFSTVCREFGIPLLCALGPALRVIEQGQVITMDADSQVVYPGNLLPQLPATAHHHLQKHLPYYRKLRKLLDGITPLHLIDPKTTKFSPESCRSLHDIIRFAHEQAIRAMFSSGDRLGNRSGNRKKLLTDLPFDIFVVDVGGGTEPSTNQDPTLAVRQIRSTPFLALWAGLTHASIQWEGRAHFNWKHFGELTLSDGIASTDAPEFASYAVLSNDYVNLHMHFGYHFTLVDVICGEDRASNYCQFRFAGGGADFSGRLLRIEFISTLLREEGFQVEIRGDLLDARISGLAIPEMTSHLVTLGRLLGATRLMDMRLHETQDVQTGLEEFMAGVRTQE